MNLRHRITLLIVLAFLAISSIGGYSILQSRNNAAEVKVVTEGVVPSALASADLVALLKDVQLATITLVTAPDENTAAQAKDKLTAQKARLKVGLELQFRQASSTTQQGLLQQAQEGLDDYFAAVDETMQFKLAGQKDLAEASLFASVAEYQRAMEQIIGTLRIEKNRTKDEAITALNENLSDTVMAIAGVSVLAALVLAAAGALLYRQITRPISRMQAMMSEIAASQDFTRRVPVDRMDEIGHSIVAFNSMITKIQESSELLQQKTADMQAMLQNIPQGILTIVDGNKVHPEFSAYLETIFETRDIAGRSMMDLVFANTHLGADALSQLEAVGGACLGEDVMNFAFNEHLLVGEIEKTMADGRVKILDLSWSPITDDADTIVRLMLCVRDVTELRKLAAEANEQKRELEIIGEILAVTQEKFHDFIAGAIKFIDENELLIRQHPEHDAETIAQLFRHMHTIKGNARTYGLQHLTNIVHEAEQTYDELRKPRPGIAWDQAMLLDELAGVKAMVECYAHINEVSLGRKGPGRRGGERYLLVDREHIQQAIQRLETINTRNLHELVAARDAVRKALRLLGTEPIGEVLGGVFESLPALAQELGKAAPLVKIEDNGYVVRNQAGSLLKNVFMHLIRNAMDHGLETPAVRLAQGKPGAGLIRLKMGVAGGMLNLRLSDDGRGLALARIRQMAVEKGLIAADAPLVDEEIARQIFRPGFSTAEKVTEVSGRGVGMDAVNDFIKREHGRIEIRFLDDAVGADFRQFEIVVCLPESLAEHVDDDQVLLVERTRQEPVAAGSAAGPDQGAHEAEPGKGNLRVV
ncbi:HAMP domain-containing protein [Pseudogulbenkiania subflava]|uniref:Chemotaxis protein CheA n=1 Tax=Pseudogulbenkiania subflava DSM 22618 TaxID=1123014 RepID=A0A1Y6BB36_9NEIS|nr:HAMP domain-containing protein [Pseudogulbenkiania subflava]SME94904.1 Histidine kinase-, DNA gyrase B-, and HSP90-like ATPase [Pseudogulbenkiania subflava DSM 22618]